MAKREPKSIAEHIIRKVGLRGSWKLGAFIMAWQQVMLDTKASSDDKRIVLHDITIGEYERWWKISTSTAYREQALFRRAFPSQSDPNALCRFLAGEKAYNLASTKPPAWLLVDA